MIAQPDGARDVKQRVDFLRAREVMLGHARALPAETVPLATAAERIVAAELRAQDDLVPYARSAMDGFALRANDTLPATTGTVVLPVAGSSFAGDAPILLEAGSACAIATGAPLPFGADAVVPIENVKRRGNAIVLSASLQPGQHVFPPGDDAKRGELLMRPGETLTPGKAALLAAAGHAAVPVYRRPRVAIVSTGDEVVGVNEQPAPGQIRNSNATMLAFQLARDGAEVVFNRHAGDTLMPLQALLREALAVSDLVVTTGGASVGQRDFVKSAFISIGARFEFGSVALRPAKPTAFAVYERTLIAVLPGNPAAAFVAYATLVRGVVRGLAGHSNPLPSRVLATLTGTIRAKAERHFVMFGKLAYENGDFTVSPLGNQCSSMVRTSADANGLIIVAPGTSPLTTGSRVEVEVVDWSDVARS